MFNHAEILVAGFNDGLQVLFAVSVLLPRHHVRMEREIGSKVLEVLYNSVKFETTGCHSYFFVIITVVGQLVADGLVYKQGRLIRPTSSHVA